MFQTALAAFIGFAAGLAGFAASQFLLKMVIEPVATFRLTLANISSSLLFHQAKLTNAHADDKIYEELKRLSAELLSKNAVIFGRHFSERLFRLPKCQDVFKACRELNGLANRMHTLRETKQDSASMNDQAMKTIGELLDVETNYSGIE